LQVEIDATYKTVPGASSALEALDAPSLDLVGPVEVDEEYVTAGKKGRERDCSVAEQFVGAFYDPNELDTERFTSEFISKQ
jgi:hypothetical protein